MELYESVKCQKFKTLHFIYNHKTHTPWEIFLETSASQT